VAGGASLSVLASGGVAGVVVALPEELATLTRGKPARGECFAISDQVLVVYAGAGPLNAAKAAKSLIDNGVTALISWGCAAGLSPELRPGDLLLPERVLSEQGECFNIDKTWLQHWLFLLSGNLSINTGSLLESSRIVSASREKQDLHSRTGAAGLDMESAAVIKAAQAKSLPCLVVRAVADPVNMDLPEAVVQALNPDGQIELTKLLGYLLAHPGQVSGLIKLGLHFHAAQKTLKIVAHKFNDIINFK